MGHLGDTQGTLALNFAQKAPHDLGSCGVRPVGVRVPPFRTNNLARSSWDRHPLYGPDCVRIIIYLTCPRFLYQQEVESRGCSDLLVMDPRQTAD